eukprot:scaffold26232_cov40-Prasinocladus_malaysianus.AAC.1
MVQARWWYLPPLGSTVLRTNVEAAAAYTAIILVSNVSLSLARGVPGWGFSAAGIESASSHTYVHPVARIASSSLSLCQRLMLSPTTPSRRPIVLLVVEGPVLLGAFMMALVVGCQREPSQERLAGRAAGWVL